MKLAPLIAGALVLIGLSQSAPIGWAQSRPPLFDNLGSLHHPIGTKSPQAQQYFDQGLRLTFGFNHEEAINAFQEAARLDPEAPMPHWGIALALGPNINAEMTAEQGAKALDAVKQARQRLGKASPQERAYIEALALRYSADKNVPRAALDRAYAEAMRAVAAQLPDDPDAAVLFAESLMDLSPWDYWTSDGKPKGATADVITTLERVLATHPDHPGACHYYIHAVEASTQPERALPCAQRLPDLMPGAGHLVHMPAHIYMRVGQYQRAVERNVEAADVDKAYLAYRHLNGSYASGYYLHNIHFLWAALVMDGRSEEAAKAARRLVQALPPSELKRAHYAQFFAASPLLTRVRFGQWDAILREPAPDHDLTLAMGFWHYARGLAQAATGRLNQASAERAELDKLIKKLAKDKSDDGATARQVLKIAERIVAGETAAKRHMDEEAIEALKEAVALEDRLRYNEPPIWHASVRLNLGAVLLAAGRAAEAEAVYEEDLRRNPENGWALFGLMQSYKAQHQLMAMLSAEERFKIAWARADITPPASRF